MISLKGTLNVWSNSLRVLKRDMEYQFDEISYYRLTEWQKKRVVETAKNLLEVDERVKLAYIFGGFTRRSSIRDVDIAVYAVPPFSLFSTPIVPNQVPTVYVDPATIIMDYVNDPGFQIGDLLQVSVNITDATDVFSYQVNVTWTTSMLNFTRVVSYGDFLAQTGSPYGTSRIEPTFIASNATGSASVAETILGDVAGVGGGGRLFTLEFLILDYGCANITISSGGDL